LSIQTTPDVLIIGAGIIGASAAWRLAQHGLSVTLVDAGEYAGESSRAGAGMLSPGGEFGDDSRWSYFSVESRRLYPAFIEELESESGEHVDLRLCGALELTRGDAEWIALQERCLIQAGLPMRSQSMTHDEAMRLAPVLSPSSFDQAVFYPDDGIIDPVDVTRALRIALTRRDVQIIEHLPVTKVDPAKGLVHAGTQCFQAGAVVIAAGAWSSAMLPAGVPEATPVKGHLIGYSLKPGFLDPVIRRGHTYMLQRSNGFLIAGATTERAGFSRTVDLSTAEELHQEAAEYIPALLAQKPDRAWIGLRPGAFNEDGEISNEPVVTRLRLADGEPSNVWLSYGHYRNGILLAPLTAKFLSGEIVTEAMELDSLNANSETE